MSGLRIKLNLLKFLGVLALALLVLAATTEGFITREAVASLAISLSVAAFIFAYAAQRSAMKTLRSAQDYFSHIERVNSQLRRARESAPASVTLSPAAERLARRLEAAPIDPPRPVTGMRPTVIEGGKAKSERLAQDKAAAEDALLLALETHELGVSLEPVVELQTSKVTAYRVHAHVKTAEGTSADMRRPAEKQTGIDPVRFDMELFQSAASSARRFPGASVDQTPLICPLGLDSLASPKDMRKIIAMMNSLPSLQAALVLEVPAAALAHEGIMASGAALLADAGLRIALEGRLPQERELLMLDRFGFEFWSLPGDDIDVTEHSASQAACVISGETRLIATGLAEEHEVIALIDEGVKLVCGPMFSLPRPVKPRGAIMAAGDERGRLGTLQ